MCRGNEMRQLRGWMKIHHTYPALVDLDTKHLSAFWIIVL
jgi:hypothetical protein